mmetsp:Transcript_1352/g.2047  ORF Transcript_1352/g.2047 Transcript_1352/m.2047 type:complete len:153 (+) Transcript_1352:132-590(+)
MDVNWSSNKARRPPQVKLLNNLLNRQLQKWTPKVSLLLHKYPGWLRVLFIILAIQVIFLACAMFFYSPVLIWNLRNSAHNLPSSLFFVGFYFTVLALNITLVDWMLTKASLWSKPKKVKTDEKSRMIQDNISWIGRNFCATSRYKMDPHSIV